MAMKYHPDKNPGDKSAEDHFKEAARAYEVLSDPEKRSRYDRFGEAGVNGHAGQGFADVDDIFSAFGDIFGDFFGGGGQRTRQGHRPRRGADLRYVLEIELIDVVNGVEKPIEFKGEQSCEHCSGSGAEPGTEPETCPSCEGAGQVIRRQGFFQMSTPCPQCHGQGKIIRVPCKDCHGKGRTLIKRKLNVAIPAGVDNGNQLRLAGEGEEGFLGGPTGDLYVEVQIKSHKNFERHGTDLLSSLEVSYLQALLGADVEVPTLEGKETLAVSAGTNSGDLTRLKSKGLPSLKSSHRGDILYQVEVKIPKKLKKEEEKLLREIADLRGEAVRKAKKGFF